MEGSAVRTHLANLDDPDDSVRHKAYLSLMDSTPTPGWVPDLIAAATDGPPHVRHIAASALGRANEAYAVAIPVLIGLLSDPDDHLIRCAAASALAAMGKRAAPDAVPALARVLKTDPSRYPREEAARALDRLWPWNADAIEVLIDALEDPHERVRHVAISALNLLRIRATPALAALRRLAENETETDANRANALHAIALILDGTPAIRLDEPHRALTDLLETARFTNDGARDAVPALLESEDYLPAFKIIEAGLDRGEQDSKVWSDMWCAAQLLDQPTADQYGARCEESWGAGVWKQLERAVRSKTTVPRGLARIVKHESRLEPHPRWKLLSKLPIAEDLARLQAWTVTAFTDDPPPEHAPGLWFGLVNIVRSGETTLDMYLDAGQLADDVPDERVIGGSWTPRSEYAHSEVLDLLHRICHDDEDSPLADAEPTISLVYAALAVRWIATNVDPQLMLGTARQRVLAVGYPNGDSIGIGTLRQDGLTFPKP